MDEVTKLCTHMTWVIRVGSVLIALLIGGYGYQATVNTSIAASQATIETHIDAADQVHEALLTYWSTRK